MEVKPLIIINSKEMPKNHQPKVRLLRIVSVFDRHCDIVKCLPGEFFTGLNSETHPVKEGNLRSQQQIRQMKTRFVRFHGGEERWAKIWQNVRFLSYRHQGGEWPLLYKTTGDLLNECAEQFGDRTACVSVYQNKRISFRETKEKADALASGILAKGIQKGDRVGIWAPNSIEWYITSFALALAGIISVYINPSYQAREIKHCINAAGVKMLVTTETFKSQNYPQILSEVAPEISTSEPGRISSKSVPTLKSVVCFSDKKIPGMIPFERLLEGGTEESRYELRKLEKMTSPDDASNIQFTSGTTGSPKGAVLSHFHIVNNSHFISKRQQFHLKEHVLCLFGPLFHAMGSVIGALTCLHSGMTLVLPEAAFSPSNVAKAIADEKCTILLGTPTMYVDVIKVTKEKGLKYTTPELAITGGAFAPPQLFLDIRDTLAAQRVASVYGLTETGPVAFMSKPTDDLEKSTTTVGFIMDHMEAKVVDDNGATVPWNTPGELWVRGYNIMQGYWGNEDKTKESLSNNWLKTGDQFVMTEDGYGRVVGRIKDMIIRGGENVYPADVEEYLSNHPDILDVQVLGVPDKRLGEQVCACIRVKPGAKLTEDDVKKFCKGKVAHFKIPYYVYFVDDYPKTSSGKVQKHLLRVQAIEFLKLSEKSEGRTSVRGTSMST